MNENIISFHLSKQFYLKDKYYKLSKDAMRVCQMSIYQSAISQKFSIIRLKSAPQANMPDMPNVFMPFSLINDPNPQTLEDEVSV
jgi:hypothetical protein